MILQDFACSACCHNDKHSSSYLEGGREGGREIKSVHGGGGDWKDRGKERRTGRERVRGWV